MSIDEAIEDYWYGYSKLPGGVQASTYWWRDYQSLFVRITYDISLRRATASSLRRRAGAHELIHILAGHAGYMWYLWKDGVKPLGYLPRPDPRQERECEYGAAFLLVPLACLLELRNEEQVYVARQLDVPEHLVELRREIYRANQE